LFWCEILADTSRLFSISARELALGITGWPSDNVTFPELIFELSKTFIANDLSRQSVTLKSKDEYDYTTFSSSEVFKDINKKTHNEYKYIEHYHAELTNLGKTILTIHNINF
jgi:hypothetical protein